MQNRWFSGDERERFRVLRTYCPTKTACSTAGFFMLLISLENVLISVWQRLCFKSLSVEHKLSLNSFVSFCCNPSLEVREAAMVKLLLVIGAVVAVTICRTGKCVWTDWSVFHSSHSFFGGCCFFYWYQISESFFLGLYDSRDNCEGLRFLFQNWSRRSDWMKLKSHNLGWLLLFCGGGATKT